MIGVLAVLPGGTDGIGHGLGLLPCTYAGVRVGRA